MKGKHYKKLVEQATALKKPTTYNSGRPFCAKKLRNLIRKENIRPYGK